MLVAIFKDDDGSISVMIPTREALAIWSMQELAERDVKSGKAFKIIDHSELPATPQEEWTFSDSFFDSGVGK